jgi:DNA-directed RNA polymerase specialized sigma subunit
MKFIKLSDKKKTNYALSADALDDLVATNDYDHKIDEIIKYVFSVASDNCKQILTLFYYDKKSMEEIAQELGYKNADTVKSKKNRCISQISERITKMHLGDEYGEIQLNRTGCR